MRTARVRNSQVRGILANLLTAISESGENIGGIAMLTRPPKTWCIISPSTPMTRCATRSMWHVED